jgi:C4-dicarboxylate transporter, DctM subunit
MSRLANCGLETGTFSETNVSDRTSLSALKYVYSPQEVWFMDPVMIGTLSSIALIIALFIGVPIAYALGAIGIVGMALIVGVQGALGHLASAAFGTSAQYSWAVFPLFVAIGNLAGMAGITTEAFVAAKNWMGRIPGGLAMATCIASGAFSACSGSSVANAAMFTPLALPEMLKHGYDKRFSVGVIASAGTFAVMIPPSIPMVIYGVITGEPIGKLLIAGIMPGLFTLACYMVAIYLRVIRKPQLGPPVADMISWQDKFKSLKGTWGVVAIFVVMIGGIYTGWVAPSSAGAIGGAVALALVVIRRKMAWTGFKQVCLDSMLVFSSIFIIIVAGSLFSRFWAISGVVQQVGDWVIGLPVPPAVILSMFAVMYLILGALIDPTSMMVLTLPLVYPIITKLGYDGIWFGVILVKLVEFAMLTPPVGFNAFVVNSAAGGAVSLEDVFAGIIPFLVLESIVMILLISFPQITLWLPSMMG